VLSYAISYAFNQALDKYFFHVSYRILGIEWLGILPILMILYFLFETAGYIYDFKKIKEYKQNLTDARYGPGIEFND
jgi:hypothetical protein